MKQTTKALVLTAILVSLLALTLFLPKSQNKVEETTESTIETTIEPTRVKIPKTFRLTRKEAELIAQLTMAEAEGEPKIGKRLVIDTIFNRVESDQFPNSVHDVIYQENAFEPMSNGRFERCEVQNEYIDLIYEECTCRTNDECIYFQAGGYSPYGHPLFQKGNHFFSGI